MRTPARAGALSVAVFTVLALMAPAVPGAGAAEASTSTAQVDIDVPTHVDLAGVVDVRFTITADPDHEPTSATVSLGHTDDLSYRLPLVKSVEIAPGECVTECTFVVPMDTVAWTRPAAGEPDANIYDYTQPLSVTVDDAAGGAWSRIDVRVDNNRPDFGCHSPCSGPGHLLADADGTLTEQYQFESYQGTPSEILVWVEGRPEIADDRIEVAPGPLWSTTTTYSTNVGQLPTGRYELWAVAFTAEGVASEPKKRTFYVDHGPVADYAWTDLARPAGTLGLPLLPADMSGWARPTVRVDASPTTDVWVAAVEMLVDGQVRFARGDMTTPGGVEVSPTWSGPALAGGAHEVVFEVTDNRGQVATMTAPQIEVDPGPTGTLRVRGDLVEQGNRPTLDARFTAYPGTTLSAWKVQVDDLVVAEGTCAPEATPCPTDVPVSVLWPKADQFRAQGPHSVLITADDDLGMHFAKQIQVPALPGTQASLAAAKNRVRRGAWNRYVGRVLKTDGRPLRRAPVRFQRRPLGETRWVTVVESTTNRYGRAAAEVRVRRSADFRLVVPAKRGSWGGSVSRRLRTWVL